jgi:hypothetical protein
MQAFARLLKVASAFSVAVGTAVLFKGTFGFEALGAYVDLQHIGLGLLLVSFLCVLVLVFIE